MTNNDERETIEREFDVDEMKSRTAMIAIGLIFMAFVLAFCLTANAATSIENSTTVQLKRGTTLITLTPAPTTLAQCETRKAELIASDALLKFSGTTTYSCILTQRSLVTFSANPPPPPPPVDCVVSAWSAWVQGTPSACLNGSQTRTDTRTRTIVTQPANGGLACAALSESQTVTLACTSPPTSETWTQCANEPNLCAFTGTRRVRYGLDPTWIYADKAAVGGGVMCTNAAFGSDPVPGKRKQCWLSSGSTTTPPPPPPATGAATLRWVAPTQNSDGSALANLAGYRIAYGTTSATLTQTITAANPLMTSYVVDALPSGVWYFAVRAYTTSGAESIQSNVATKSIP